MGENLTVDEALSMIVSLTEEIDALAPDDRRRAALEHQREELRAAARSAADASRPEVALRHELEALEARLAQIDARPIGKGWAEKGRYRWVNDPGAYSSQINAMLDEQDADERAVITARITELEALVAE